MHSTNHHSVDSASWSAKLLKFTANGMCGYYRVWQSDLLFDSPRNLSRF